jgi:hypothetical protein
VTAPLSYDRVLATLKRLSPQADESGVAWPTLEDVSDVVKELAVVATPLGRAADLFDLLLDELFPDTANLLLDRWEKSFRIATRVGDDLDARRARVLAVIRRTSGPRVDQLAKVLAGPLAATVDDLIFVEQLRQFIEEALIETTGAVALAVPSVGTLQVYLGKPWPGVVDDRGVDVYLDLSAVGTTTATITSPRGTNYLLTDVAAGAHTYMLRSQFLGEPAGGRWTLTINDSAEPTLHEFRLLVSNDIDSAQIYNFFCLRDPALPGTADLVEAQRLFKRTALAHMRAFVVESLALKFDDPHSLFDRDVIGA